jgi:hypothetical protein
MYVGEENVLNKILKPNRNGGHCTMRNPMIETGHRSDRGNKIQPARILAGKPLGKVAI